jgi:hypothetical protein
MVSLCALNGNIPYGARDFPEYSIETDLPAFDGFLEKLKVG